MCPRALCLGLKDFDTSYSKENETHILSAENLNSITCFYLLIFTAEIFIYFFYIFVTDKKIQWEEVSKKTFTQRCCVFVLSFFLICWIWEQVAVMLHELYKAQKPRHGHPYKHPKIAIKRTMDYCAMEVLLDEQIDSEHTLILRADV